MIVRHAEKPVRKEMRGIRANGRADKGSLTTLGWQRAGALVPFFANAGRRQAGTVERPDHLFAARFDPESESPSRRPKQTLGPLAAALQLEIDDAVDVGDEASLVAAVMQRSGTVLIAWEHDAIPAIAQAIPGCADDVPGEWPDDRFDLVWIFERLRSRWTFTQRPQLLLADDSNEGIA